MTKSLILGCTALSLALGGCGGPEQLALPSDPIERAATCGVVTAAEARTQQTNVSSPLAFDTQGAIMHYALLAGAENQSFSRERAAKVVARMGELGDSLTEKKWETLIGPCRESFPATDPAKPISLPEDRLESQMSCYMLGDFLAKAMKMQGNTYGDQLIEYGMLNNDLDPKIASGLARRGIAGNGEKAKALRNAALADAAQRGSPMAVMEKCKATYNS